MNCRVAKVATVQRAKIREGEKALWKVPNLGHHFPPGHSVQDAGRGHHKDAEEPEAATQSKGRQFWASKVAAVGGGKSQQSGRREKGVTHGHLLPEVLSHVGERLRSLYPPNCPWPLGDTMSI